MSFSSAVIFDDLSFSWPDGTVALSRVSGAFSHTKTGLIGANGAGKSTLLRFVAGELQPSSGSVTCRGDVEYLRQDVTEQSGTLADLLGISHILRALVAVEQGDASQENFDTIADNWDIEARAEAALSEYALPTDLNRPVSSLSGGEAMLAAILGVHLRGADIALLDEPTNNLDMRSRARLYELIRRWRGTLIVVSHDLDLLELMEETAELREGGIQTFGGPYSAYREWLATQQAAAAQSLRTAEQRLARQKRERMKTEERIAHSERQGKKDRLNNKYPPLVAGLRKSAAEQSQGARRGRVDDRIAAAREAVVEAERRVRDDEEIHIDLPDPGVHSSRLILEIPSSDGRNYVMQGPERVALVGDNGVGKTTLLERLLPEVRVRWGYVRQRVELDDQTTVLDAVREAAPHTPPSELRNQLARFLIRGDSVHRPMVTLSGGERFRVVMAREILADPPPELLVLDEPTNNLDLASVNHLIAALCDYRGALLVVSHDRRFLAELELDLVVELQANGVLERRDPAGFLGQ